MRYRIWNEILQNQNNLKNWNENPPLTISSMLFRDAHSLISLENHVLPQAQLSVLDKVKFLPAQKWAGKEGLAN